MRAVQTSTKEGNTDGVADAYYYRWKDGGFRVASAKEAAEAKEQFTKVSSQAKQLTETLQDYNKVLKDIPDGENRDEHLAIMEETKEALKMAEDEARRLQNSCTLL